MRRLAISLSSLLYVVFFSETGAQDLRLNIQRQANPSLLLSVDPVERRGHTFIEFSTNRLWFPAFFTASNSTEGLAYNMTNLRGARIYRARQGPVIAQTVKESWQRLGVTNYVFDYTRQCL